MFKTRKKKRKSKLFLDNEIRSIKWKENFHTENWGWWWMNQLWIRYFEYKHTTPIKKDMNDFDGPYKQWNISFFSIIVFFSWFKELESSQKICNVYKQCPNRSIAVNRYEKKLLAAHYLHTYYRAFYAVQGGRTLTKHLLGSFNNYIFFVLLILILLKRLILCASYFRFSFFFAEIIRIMRCA